MLVLWAALIAVACGVCSWTARRRRQSPWVPLLWLATPVAALGLIVTCFVVGHAHRVVQLSADRELWRLWASAWIGLLVLSAVAVPGVLFLVGTKRVTGTGAALLASANAFTLWGVFAYAPQA